MLKFQYFSHLFQRVDSLEKSARLGKLEGERRMGQQSMRWLDSISVNGHKFVQTPGDGEEQRSLACCSPWGRKELDMP